MQKYFVLLTVLVAMLISSCAGISQLNSSQEVLSDMMEWDSSSYFNKRIMGKLFVTVSGEFGSGAEVTVFDNNRDATRVDYVIGTIGANETYEITILKGNYSIAINTKSSFTKDPVYHYAPFVVVGGEEVTATANLKEIKIESGSSPSKKIKKVGTLFFQLQVDARIKANLKLTNNILTNRGPQVAFFTVSGTDGDPKFYLNKVQLYPEIKNSKGYSVRLNLTPGYNELLAHATGLDGKVISRKFTFHNETAEEIESRKLALIEIERKKAEEQKQKLIAKKLEEERIAREGDGTPDDLSCKKYGLKVQTQGYAECRMRLDIMRKENQRTQGINAANQRNAENARKAELQRRYEEVEQENAVIANRKSRCRFVQSQEYLRPALGGFFESMNRANSAFDNCMAGIPQINTTCTKDAFGNINCTSR
jgi:hypothetical protein